MSPLSALDLRFNLSHTDDLVMCAVCRAREVGVDVEKIDPTLPHLEIARTAFAPPEAHALERCPCSDRIAAFYSLWTLREAYAKARGMGFAIATDQFWFDLGKRPSIEIRFAAPWQDSPDAWIFEQLKPTPEHMISIALERRHDDPTREVEINTIDGLRFG